MASIFIHSTALLFLVFNRPQTTRKVWEWIRWAKPSRIYIASDGARISKLEEREKVEEVRQIINSGIDWEVEVKTLYQSQNLGCKYAVSSAIDWFFEQETEGVILEDDCVPGQDFLGFCTRMLEHYRENDQIMHISGNNFLNGKVGLTESYYFSRLTHIWGWATWRRAWRKYDVKMSNWPNFKSSKKINEIWPIVSQRNYWEKRFEAVYRGEIDTWDYQWTMAMWANGGYAINPSVNLVTNIGFNEDATHTRKVSSWLVVESQPLSEIIHPKGIVLNNKADFYSSSFLYPSLVDKLKIKLRLLP